MNRSEPTSQVNSVYIIYIYTLIPKDPIPVCPKNPGKTPYKKPILKINDWGHEILRNFREGW